MDASVFVLSEEQAKSGRERIVPLNAAARSIIETRRPHGGEHVFEFDGRRLSRMTNTAWDRARTSANLRDARVHGLRHTFGMRLRAAGVSHEDRQDLLGHHGGNVTTHYSEVEISRLIECVELLCDDKKMPELTLIRRAS
jgi:integrase